MSESFGGRAGEDDDFPSICGMYDSLKQDSEVKCASKMINMVILFWKK